MICVLTTEGILFEVKGNSWLSEKIRANDGTTLLVAKVTHQGERIAEFIDVHAIWYKDKGDIIPGDDDN